MYLFLDESDSGKRKVLGGILVPNSLVSEFEKKFVETRQSEKVFGEVKWTKIETAYEKKYKKFIDLFFDEPLITYHSYSYKNVSEKLRAVAYSLIRSVDWKIINSGVKEPLHIIFDENGAGALESYKKISKTANIDVRFKSRIEFCNEGNSHCLGALQIADLLTGAVGAKINSSSIATAKKSILDYIELKNKKEIGVSLDRLPKLNEYKMHHLDMIKY